MWHWQPSTYGDMVADVYDRWFDDPASVDGIVTTLADLAGVGPVLELGIGTGRIALPLAQRGVDVHGIDASEAMVARLRAKPGGDQIPVTLGDFADVAIEGTYSMVFAIVNTLFALTTQDDQVRCFENVARRLGVGGTFVVGASVPDPNGVALRNGVTAMSSNSPDEIVLVATIHDPVRQTLVEQDITLSGSGIRLHPGMYRYSWPSEFDLMARIAGLRLRHRWSGWQREAFTAASTRHISVYERIAPG